MSGNPGYNLHTGIDRHYRGRGLAKAIKSIALDYAKEKLCVRTVRTNHNSNNIPMIRIDEKMGYEYIPGIMIMEKTIAL